MQALRERLKKIHQAGDRTSRQVILDLLEPNVSCRLLDLGCDDGRFTLELGRKIGTSDLHGVDMVDESLQLCEAKRIKTYRANLNEPLPLDSESFDMVHANYIMEHVYNTDLFVKEIHRVLRRQGYTVISVPNLAAWHNILCLFLGWQPFPASLSDEIDIGNPLHGFYKTCATRSKYPSHQRIPTYRGLKELLLYHGFSTEKIAGAGYYPLWGMASRLVSRLDPRHSAYLIVKSRKT